MRIRSIPSGRAFALVPDGDLSGRKCWRSARERFGDFMRRFLRETSIGLRPETIVALDAAAHQLRRSGQRNASRSGLVRRIVERAIQDAKEGHAKG